MDVFRSLSYLDPAYTLLNATLVQCPIKIPLASWDPFSFNAAAKVSTVLAITVNVLTMPLTLFLNALIMFVVWKNPSLQVERVIVLVYLALTDFLVGLICQPLFVVRGVLQLNTSDQNCNINTVYIFSVIFLTVAAFNQLMLVTYERYVAIIHPYQYPTRITVKRLTYITIGLWALYTPLAILYFALMAFDVPVWYIDIYYGVTGASFTALMVYWFARIFAAIRRQERQIDQQNANINNPRTERYKRGAITSGLLLGCFLISVIPLICAFLTKQVLKLSFSGPAFLSCLPWVFTFSHLNSFVNPIIYGLRMRELRDKCLQLLRFKTNL